MNSLWLFTVVAAVGTTLTPWGQFFIQAAVVDKKISCASTCTRSTRSTSAP